VTATEAVIISAHWNSMGAHAFFPPAKPAKGAKMHMVRPILIILLAMLAQGHTVVHSAMAKDDMGDRGVMQQGTDIEASALFQTIAASNPRASRKPISEARREWSDRFLACDAPMRACMVNCNVRAQSLALDEKFFLRCLNRLCDKYLVASCFQQAGPLPR
jgi:hypothetical protein